MIVSSMKIFTTNASSAPIQCSQWTDPGKFDRNVVNNQFVDMWVLVFGCKCVCIYVCFPFCTRGEHRRAHRFRHRCACFIRGSLVHISWRTKRIHASISSMYCMASSVQTVDICDFLPNMFPVKVALPVQLIEFAVDSKS